MRKGNFDPHTRSALSFIGMPEEPVCPLCGAIDRDHNCPFALAAVPPAVVAADAWSTRFSMFAVVAFIGVIISFLALPGLLSYLLTFGILAVAAAVGFRLLPAAYARYAPPQPTSGEGVDPRVALRVAILRTRGRVSADLAQRLSQMRDTLERGLDYADRADVGDLDSHILRESAATYVPEIIEYYLSLPANAPRTTGGRTGEEELDYQLGLIEDRVQKVLDGQSRELVSDFEAHGRFLRERLEAGKSSLDIAVSPSEAKAAERERERVR